MISSVQTVKAPASVTRPVASVALKPQAVPVQSAGPAATLQLSQQALAHVNNDTDWQPGAKVDSK